MLTPIEVVLEDKPCPLGCIANDRQVLVGKDRLHNLPGRFAVVRCGHCDLMRTNPRPSPQSIALYYPEDYGPYEGTRVRVDKLPAVSRWKRVVRSIFRFNTNCIPPMFPGRLLEVGCASGAFLYTMAKQNWKAEGIEFASKPAEAARALGFKVHVGSLETAPDPEGSYDLIVAWMVIEHLHDPMLALEKLYRWTKPNGWLVISTPNAGSVEFRLFKDAWYALQLPTHLYHFAPTTVRKILDKAGWKIERIQHHRNLSNLFASSGYILRDRFPNSGLARWLIRFPEHPGFYNYLLFPLAYILSLFGQTGRMTVWARRND